MQTQAFNDQARVSAAPALFHRYSISVLFLFACLGLTPGCSESTGFSDQGIGQPDNASGAFTAVDVGDNTTCALDEMGRAYCWGSNFFGDLGTGDTAHLVKVPTLVASLPAAFRLISVGANHQCALTTDGRGYCWGGNGGGQLGAGVAVKPGDIAPVAGGLTFASISAGSGYTCAITTEQMAYCWGGGGNGQLGAGASSACNYASFPCSVYAPVSVAGDLHFTQISAGYLHACAITNDGTGYCWGDNRNGELGDPSVPINCVGFPGAAQCIRAIPNLIAGGLKFAQIAAGAYHTCGLTTSGKAYCWGLVTADSANQAFALGNAAYSGELGTQRGSRVPVPVDGGFTFREITAGWDVSCGLIVSGEAVCWGDNRWAQLGTGSLGPLLTSSPLLVRMPLAQHAPAIDTDYHACALTAAGRIWCWGGMNFFGELGSEPLSEPNVRFDLRLLPTPVDAPETFYQ